jgi:hypothetical protein
MSSREGVWRDSHVSELCMPLVDLCNELA